MTTLVPRRKDLNGLNNDAKSPPLLLLLLPLLPDDDDIASPEDDKLDLGTAIMEVIGGEEVLVVADAVIFIPSDDVDQGRNTLIHEREVKSQIRSVPSSDPLASSVLFALPKFDDNDKLAGSSNANDVTLLTCPFNSDT